MGAKAAILNGDKDIVPEGRSLRGGIGPFNRMISYYYFFYATIVTDFIFFFCSE